MQAKSRYIGRRDIKEEIIMARQLVIGCFGNGKSTNRYHIPLLMRR